MSAGTHPVPTAAPVQDGRGRDAALRLEADGGIRTPDPRFTREGQLSSAGTVSLPEALSLTSSGRVRRSSTTAGCPALTTPGTHQVPTDLDPRVAGTPVAGARPPAPPAPASSAASSHSLVAPAEGGPARGSLLLATLHRLGGTVWTSELAYQLRRPLPEVETLLAVLQGEGLVEEREPCFGRTEAHWGLTAEGRRAA